MTLPAIPDTHWLLELIEVFVLGALLGIVVTAIFFTRQSALRVKKTMNEVGLQLIQNEHLIQDLIKQLERIDHHP